MLVSAQLLVLRTRFTYLVCEFEVFPLKGTKKRQGKRNKQPGETLTTHIS